MIVLYVQYSLTVSSALHRIRDIVKKINVKITVNDKNRILSPWPISHNDVNNNGPIIIFGYYTVVIKTFGKLHKTTCTLLDRFV